MADVFVSYKREDRAIAERVVAGLEGAGHLVWWDTGLTPGKGWDAEIEREISAAKAVVVIWTPRSVVPDTVVRDEADYAREHGKLAPVLAEPCDIPFLYRRVHYANLVDWSGTPDHPGWRQLLDRVSRLIAGETLEDPEGLSGASDTAALVSDFRFTGAKVVGPRPGERWERVHTFKTPRKALLPLPVFGQLEGSLSSQHSRIHDCAWAADTLAVITSGFWMSNWNHDRNSITLCNARTGKTSVSFPLRMILNHRMLECSTGGPDATRLAISHSRGVELADCSPHGAQNAATLRADGQVYPSIAKRLNDKYPDRLGDEVGHHVAAISPDGTQVAEYGRWCHYRDASGQNVNRFRLRIWTCPRGRWAYNSSVRFKDVEVEGSWGTKLTWSASGKFLLMDQADLATVFSPDGEVISTTSLRDGQWWKIDLVCSAVHWLGQKDLIVVPRNHSSERRTRVDIVSPFDNSTVISRDLGHSHWGFSIGVSPDGRFIATGAEDHAVIIWDLVTDTTRVLHGRDTNPGPIWFSPDGQRLAIQDQGRQGTVSLWDPATGEKLAEIPGSAISYKNSLWCRDALTLAVRNGKPGEVEIWKLA